MECSKIQNNQFNQSPNWMAFSQIKPDCFSSLQYGIERECLGVMSIGTIYEFCVRLRILCKPHFDGKISLCLLAVCNLHIGLRFQRVVLLGWR